MNPRDLNYTSQLVTYLSKNLKKGYTKESLRWALVNQGHSQIEIDKAFKKLEEEQAKAAPILKTKPEIKREVYDHNDSIINTPAPEKKSFMKKFFG